MEFEEFQESDVIFSDDYSSSDQSTDDIKKSFRVGSKLNRHKKEQRMRRSSVPVDIPEISSCFSSSLSSCSSSSSDLDDFDDDDFDSVVPPHVIVDRRSIDGGQIAFSYNSYERNVKRSRHLIHVRNSILRMTGFLES